MTCILVFLVVFYPLLGCNDKIRRWDSCAHWKSV